MYLYCDEVLPRERTTNLEQVNTKAHRGRCNLHVYCLIWDIILIETLFSQWRWMYIIMYMYQ